MTKILIINFNLFCIITDDYCLINFVLRFHHFYVVKKHIAKKKTINKETKS